MSKSTRLPERPKPPTVEQIIEDIKAAKDNDVVYSFGTCGTPGASRDGTPLSSSSDGSLDFSKKTSELPQQEPDASEANISATYLKTLQLLSLTELLRSSPDQVKEQYDQLEKLGVEVSDAISELKAAASNVRH